MIMTSFKLAKKDAVTDTRTNIYDLHEKKLEYFESEKGKLIFYQKQLEQLKKGDYNSKLQNINLIINLTDKIESIESDSELNEYLLDFVKIINNGIKDESFDNIEQKGVMDTFVSSTINNSKSELYNEYIAAFNGDLQKITINKNCGIAICKCGKKDSFIEVRTSTEICINCGSTLNIIYNTESAPIYSDNIEKVVVFNYKRDTHFQECLNQLQAKENTTIPPKIIQDLTVEFKKYNISNKKLFTNELLKSYLKKLGYSKYYEHIPTIINEFCGLSAPKFTPELEQQLKLMFDEIQVPFEKYKKIVWQARKNFLNYAYCFYKMLELLNKDEFLGYFPLIKSRQILYEHDQIWKGICNDLRWEFIPTI